MLRGSKAYRTFRSLFCSQSLLVSLRYVFPVCLFGKSTKRRGLRVALFLNMMLKKRLFLLLLLVCAFASATHAQTAAQERATRLHEQLVELQAKQSDLQGRLDILNEQLKPENIEKSLAGVGSTKPEDLRELRRRQLETEKNGIEKQLAVLNESRSKLEAGIAQADAIAYQQSALPARSSEKDIVANDSNVQPRQASSVQPRQASRKRVRARRVKH